MKRNVKIIKRYCCPHCLTVQPKGPGWIMLASGADEGMRGVYHLDVLERVREISCPHCRHPLDPQRLIKGDYDYRDWSADGASLVGLVLTGALHWIGGLSWWAALGIAASVAILLGMLLSRWQKQSIRARTLTR